MRNRFRKMWGKTAVLLGLLFSYSLPVAAQSAPGVASDPEQVAVARLLTLRPDLPVADIYPSLVAGIYGVKLEGGMMLYVTEDGKHLFAGDLFALEQGFVNLTELSRNDDRRLKLEAVSPQDMVIFPTPEPPLAVVYVFTDVDCGYCRKLHNEIAQYNERGIEIRYLAYPRDGLGSETFLKMESVWCSGNRQAAMTRAKRGQEVAAAGCVTPIAKQFELGVQLGVEGTPSLVTSDGQMLPGYVPASVLAQRMGLEAG